MPSEIRRGWRSLPEYYCLIPQWTKRDGFQQSGTFVKRLRPRICSAVWLNLITSRGWLGAEIFTRRPENNQHEHLQRHYTSNFTSASHPTSNCLVLSGTIPMGHITNVIYDAIKTQVPLYCILASSGRDQICSYVRGRTGNHVGTRALLEIDVSAMYILSSYHIASRTQVSLVVYCRLSSDVEIINF